MDVTIQEQDDKVVAILAGRLNTASASQTEKALSPLYDVDGKDIIIDCTDMSYISSIGLRIFLSILKNTEQKGRRVYLKGLNDEVRNVFNITGFSNLFGFV